MKYIIRSDLTFSYATSLPPPPQTELSDGVSMMVSSNDRMQGIISQLEETCRTIEVSIQPAAVLGHSLTQQARAVRTH